MPLVYACICPHELPSASEAQRTTAALRRVAEELAAYEIETALIITSRGPARHESMGVLIAAHIEGLSCEVDHELARRVLHEVAEAGLRAVELRRWEGPLPYPGEALGGARVLPVTTCWLDPRAHFEFGRAIGRALAAHERRVALVCCAELSRALTPGGSGYDPAGKVFDEHYRRAIEAWDVKWLVGLERDLRKRAAEDAVTQTAVLMGALSGYRIQPRVLSYEARDAVRHIVAAIDVLGRRMKERAAAKPSADAGGDTEAEAR